MYIYPVPSFRLLPEWQNVFSNAAYNCRLLSQLHLKKNLLLCCITRGNEIKIPRGGDEIQVGDNVIVVTLEHGLHDLRDIVED